MQKMVGGGGRSRMMTRGGGRSWTGCWEDGWQGGEGSRLRRRSRSGEGAELLGRRLAPCMAAGRPL